jgi:GH18 family chitinase
MAKPAYPVVVYIQGGKSIDLSSLAWDDMTHIDEAFAHVHADGTIKSRKRDGLVSMAHGRNVRCILSLGGMGDSNENWRQAIGPNQDAFIKNIMDYLIVNNYDGVDVDWEFPREQDMDPFTIFMTKLSTSVHATKGYDGKPKEIMFCICEAPDSNGGYNYPGLGKIVDYGILMSYNSLPSVERSSQTVLNLGFPAEKLLIGLGLFDSTGTNTVTRVINEGKYNDYDENQEVAIYYYKGTTVTVNTARSITARLKWVFSRPTPFPGIAVWQATYAYPLSEKSAADLWSAIGGGYMSESAPQSATSSAESNALDKTDIDAKK